MPSLTSTATATAAAAVTMRTVPSPIGPLTLRARDGALTGVHMSEHRHAPAPPTRGAAPGAAPTGGADAAVLDAAARQLDEYFAGERTEFDLPVDLEGTAFQRRVWAALTEIPYGETISYGELARRIGQPTASRAVGLANGRNPVSIVVPCHRVIGAAGALVGYGGGLDRKRHLLAHEAGQPGLAVDG